MLKAYLEILKDLISRGEIERNDVVVDQTKEGLIKYMCDMYPDNQRLRGYIGAYVDKIFDEELGV